MFINSMLLDGSVVHIFKEFIKVHLRQSWWLNEHDWKLNWISWNSDIYLKAIYWNTKTSRNANGSQHNQSKSKQDDTNKLTI